MKPLAQVQAPVERAVPWALHVIASEYWQVAPTNPALQEQVPVALAQVPDAEQVCTVPGAHAPAWQVSAAVHEFPSLQLAPLLREPHVPFDVAPAAMLQAWQSVVLPPPQAELQQRASTQNFEEQSALSEQAAPLANATPQYPSARQLGAPEPHAFDAPDPKLPSHATQEPDVEPLRLHTGNAASVQFALDVQGVAQTLLLAATEHAWWLASQFETFDSKHGAHSRLIGSHSEAPGTLAQSASVLQQAAPAATWSEAWSFRISCCDQDPPVDPVKPI